MFWELAVKNVLYNKSCSCITWIKIKAKTQFFPPFLGFFFLSRNGPTVGLKGFLYTQQGVY